MNIAVIGTSRKEKEKRVPIHPAHIESIPEEIRRHLFFEKGYGLSFGVDDETIANLTGNSLQERKKLISNQPGILITKPVLEDFESMRDGTVVWGWLHSVQHRYITQIAIDKKLTLIAWENMYYEGKRDLLHIFNKNNEMAGYCGVQHALEVTGLDGNFGPPLSASVLSLGSVSRGAIYALLGHGIRDITVYTKRPTVLVADRLPGIRYFQIEANEAGYFDIIDAGGAKSPLLAQLSASDIIVNGVLQDPLHPDMFVNDEDVDAFPDFCLAIDVSCSKGMGFSFAESTTFSDPIIKVGNIRYYGVDHTPSLLWNSASWEISRALLPYLPYVVEETENKVISDAVDIQEGNILNRDILLYQNRSSVYPYKQL